MSCGEGERLEHTVLTLECTTTPTTKAVVVVSGGKGRKKGRDDESTAISAETTMALCYVIHQHSATEAAAASEDK